MKRRYEGVEQGISLCDYKSKWNKINYELS
jgi:hypothetical protein